MAAVIDMPTFLTTLRGKGGWGATQKLCDMFWVFTSSASSSRHISTLIHTYVAVKAAVTDANMKVIYGFPLGTFTPQNQANKNSANRGELALGTGLKIYISPTNTPIEDYYGFYTPRMTPFFKSTGGNEIDILINGDSSRTVQCWYHGSNNGGGFCLLHNAAYSTYMTGKYFATFQYSGLPLVICKIGKTTGVATHGDVIVVPAW